MTAEASSRSWWWEAILVVAGILALACYLPFRIWGDGALRMVALSVMLTRQPLFDVKYSLIGPLCSTPLWVLGLWVKSPEWWCARYNLFLFAATAVVFWRLPAEWMPYRLRTRFLLLLVACSMFPYHLSAYYGEVFTALLCGLGFMAVAHGRIGWGGIALILGCANTPASLLGLLLALGWHYRKVRTWWWIPVATVGIAATEMAAHHGMVGYFNTPTDSLGFNNPFLVGCLAQLVSFGKGLVFFAPGLLLLQPRRLAGLPEGLADTLRMWLLFLLGLVLVYAKWWDWSGDWFWGPRFLLFASLPAALLLAVALEKVESMPEALLVLGVLAMSTWVGAESAVYGMLDIQEMNVAATVLPQYVPAHSVLWRLCYISWPLHAVDVAMLGYFVLAFVTLASRLWPWLSRKL